MIKVFLFIVAVTLISSIVLIGVRAFLRLKFCRASSGGREPQRSPQVQPRAISLQQNPAGETRETPYEVTKEASARAEHTVDSQKEEDAAEENKLGSADPRAVLPGQGSVIDHLSGACASASTTLPEVVHQGVTSLKFEMPAQVLAGELIEAPPGMADEISQSVEGPQQGAEREANPAAAYVCADLPDSTAEASVQSASECFPGSGDVFPCAEGVSPPSDAAQPEAIAVGVDDEAKDQDGIQDEEDDQRRENRARSLSRYRSATVGLAGTYPSRARSSDRHGRRERALRIGVRFLFHEFGSCRVSLLPRRSHGFPDELVVSGAGETFEVRPMHEHWYQDLARMIITYSSLNDADTTTNRSIAAMPAA